MAKAFKRIAIIGITMIMAIGAFTLSGCDNVSLEDYKISGKAKIDAHVATKTESDNWAILCSIAESGKTAIDEATTKPQVDDLVNKTKHLIDMGFYEIEVDDMVDCSRFLYNAAQSSLGNPITLTHSESEAIFECVVNKGMFDVHGEEPKKSCIVQSGNGFFWYPDEHIQNAFVDVLLKVNDIIIGYAVIEIYPNDSVGITYKARTVVSKLFPKIDGQYQTITQELINIIINNIKMKN